MKFVTMVGAFNGSMTLNNFSYLSKVELQHLATLSKNKMIFQEECIQETKL